MKKVFALFGAAAFLAFSACSGDDDATATDPIVSDDVLVKKINYQFNGDGEDYEVTYTYDGNKLVKGVYDMGGEERYFYNGDQISRIEYDDAEFSAEVFFTYDNSGMLTEVRYQEPEDDYEERSTFASVNATTVTETYYSGSIGNTTPDWTATLTLVDGEVAQKVQNGFSTYTYVYDTKNSPFKNVTGFAAIAHANAGDHETEGRSKNILSIHNDTENQNYTVNTFTYNANNYPTSVTSVGIFDETLPNVTTTLNAQYTY